MDVEEYEKRIWNVGLYEWGWEVRVAGNFMGPFKTGRSDTRREANAAVQTAIDTRETRNSVKWKKVRRQVSTDA